jgi:hypothetical protein
VKGFDLHIGTDEKDYLHPNRAFMGSENWEFSNGYFVMFGNGICDKVTFVSGCDVKKVITEFFKMASYPVTWYTIWPDFMKLDPVSTDFSHLKHSTQDLMSCLQVNEQLVTVFLNMLHLCFVKVCFSEV